MVEHNNDIPNAVPIEEAMLLLATALEGRLEESDRPRLEQALLQHPSLRAAAADGGGARHDRALVRLGRAFRGFRHRRSATPR